MAVHELSPRVSTCSFCGRRRFQVRGLAVSAAATHAICTDCLDTCRELLEQDVKKPALQQGMEPLPRPSAIKRQLDAFVVGQERVKRIVSVAVYNHYKRIAMSSPGASGGGTSSGERGDGVDPGKSNVLLLGPSGSGKTLIVQALATLLDVPLFCGDATTLTEAGYVGEDAESLVTGLYEAAGRDLAACQRGIVFLDEIDKTARRAHLDGSARDVGGEGVQQGLLKLVEGTRCRIWPREGQKGRPVEVDTSGILFVCAGAFVGLDAIVKRRIGGRCIGFDTQAVEPGDDFVLDRVEPEDLASFGMIPELIGRLPVLAATRPLGESDLVEVLRTPRNSLLRQYRALFRRDGIRLGFTDGALRAVARRALDSGLGARGLRRAMEELLLPWMFELPSRPDVRELRLTENAVLGLGEPELLLRDAS